MIDPKELRIGAHINLNGERVVVDEITNTALVAYVTPDNDWAATDPAEDWIEPIPITAELLEELGFEKVTLHTRPKPIIQYVDAESIKAQAENLDVRVVPRITIQHINVANPFWSVSAYGKNMEDNKAAVRYLHELEAFLYLTTKTELIKD